MNRPPGCLVLLLAPLLIYGAWVSYPPSRYEAMSVQVLKDGAARHAEEQKYARRPDRNAYINPDFLPFWGREGIEKRDPSPAGEQLKVLDGLCDLYEGKDVGLEKRFREPGIRKRCEKFQQFYSRIHKLCQLPDFVAPLNQPGDLLTSPIDMVAVRRLPIYLSGYAEYLAVQGKSAEALSVAVDSLRFARLVNHQQSSVLRCMIGLAVQQLSQSSLAMLLDSTRPEVPLGQVLQTLEATQLPASAFGECLESEYCQAMNSLTGPSTNQSFSWIPSPPGLESREFRLYKNDFMEMLQQVRQGQPIPSGWVAGFGTADWLLGRHGWLSAIAIPNYPKINIQFNLLRTRQAFLHAFVGILQFHQQNGRFPADLEQLRASGYQALDGLDPKRLDYELTGGRASLKLTLSAAEMPYGTGHVAAGMEKWNRLNGLNWRLRTGP